LPGLGKDLVKERTTRPLMLVGLILVLLGVLALGYQGVAYITTRDTVAKAGPLEVQADRTHAVPLWPILSGAALLAGVLCMIAAANRRTT
jgi:hypothetical protein